RQFDAYLNGDYLIGAEYMSATRKLRYAIKHLHLQGEDNLASRRRFNRAAIYRCRIDESGFERVSAVFQGPSRSDCYGITPRSALWIRVAVRASSSSCRA